MDITKLEDGLENLSDAATEFDDTLTDIQMNSAPTASVADIQRWRLLEAIDSDLSGLDRGVVAIKKKIEQIKELQRV